MSYGHVLGVANGNEPLLPTDARDLAAVLDMPPAWLRYAWVQNVWAGVRRRGRRAHAA